MVLQVAEEGLDVEAVEVAHEVGTAARVEALQRALEPTSLRMPTHVEIEEAPIAGQAVAGRLDHPIGRVAVRAADGLHRGDAGRVLGGRTGEGRARDVQHEPLREVEVALGDLCQIAVPVGVVEAEARGARQVAGVRSPVRGGELDRAGQGRPTDAIALRIVRGRGVVGVQSTVRDELVPDEGPVGRVQRAAADALTMAPDDHREVVAEGLDAIDPGRTRHLHAVRVHVPDVEDVVQARRARQSVRQMAVTEVQRGGAGHRFDQDVGGTRGRFRGADPAIGIGVGDVQDLLPRLDRQHLDDARAVVVRCVATHAGVLGEVRTSTRIAVGQVVTARAADLVARGDLRGRAVRHRAAQVRGVRVEHAVADTELAEAEVASELVREEGIAVEEPGGRAGLVRIVRVHRAHARVLDRATGHVDSQFAAPGEVGAFGVLGSGRNGEDRDQRGCGHGVAGCHRGAPPRAG